MQQTTNLKFNKIELTDSPPDITVLNPNFDKIDAELYPTIDPSVAPSGNIGFAKALLGGLANRIKVITGKTNWWDSPTKSLEQLNTDKVDKVTGKGLSTNDYANADKQQVAKISSLESQMGDMTTLKNRGYITSTSKSLLDPKTIVDNGKYLLNGGIDMPLGANSSGTYWVLDVTTVSNITLVQYITCVRGSANALGKTFARYCDNGTWSGWTKILDQKDYDNLLITNPNLLVNGSGELGMTSWRDDSSKKIYPVLDGFGNGSFFKADAMTVGDASYPALVNFINSNPNAVYTLSAEMYAQISAGNIRIEVHFRDASNTFLDYRYVEITASESGAWKRKSVTFTTPANTVKLEIKIMVYKNTDITLAYWKRIKLEKGSIATPYSMEANTRDYSRNPIIAKADSTSTSTAYTVTLTPAPLSYGDNFPITLIPSVDSGTNPTLNVNNLGAGALLDQNGNPMVMKANRPYQFVRVGSDFFQCNGGGKPVANVDKFGATSSIFQKYGDKNKIVNDDGTYYYFVNDYVNRRLQRILYSSNDTIIKADNATYSSAASTTAGKNFVYVKNDRCYVIFLDTGDIWKVSEFNVNTMALIRTINANIYMPSGWGWNDGFNASTNTVLDINSTYFLQISPNTSGEVYIGRVDTMAFTGDRITGRIIDQACLLDDTTFIYTINNSTLGIGYISGGASRYGNISTRNSNEILAKIIQKCEVKFI